MQGKSEKNADSLTFMCYPVTFVTFTMQKEARAHHSGLFRYGNKKLRVGDCVLGRVALLQAGGGLASRAAPRSQKNEASDKLQPH